MTDTATPIVSQPSPSVIYYVVASKPNRVVGFTWRLFWGRTSFYLKVDHRATQSLKISLHGPDPDHSEPGFSVHPDGNAADDGTAAIIGDLTKRLRFTGMEIAPGVRHVIRLRADWGMFEAGVPSEPWAGKPHKSGRMGLVAQAHRFPFAADLDIYISDGAPYWGDEARGRKNDALIGPIKNRADQYLTAHWYKRTVITHPAPQKVWGPQPQTCSDRVRGLGYAVAEDGLLWVQEQWLSRQALVSGRVPLTWDTSVGLAKRAGDH